MPDHVHFLMKFSPDMGLRKTVENWKRYTARHAGIRWQRDFFDHRLRNNESFQAKALYIRFNPVRAGLVTNPEDWNYKLEHR